MHKAKKKPFPDNFQCFIASRFSVEDHRSKSDYKCSFV